MDRREVPGLELSCAITLMKDASRADLWEWRVKVGGHEVRGVTSGSRRDAWGECRVISENLWNSNKEVTNGS